MNRVMQINMLNETFKYFKEMTKTLQLWNAVCAKVKTKICMVKFAKFCYGQISQKKINVKRWRFFMK